MSIDKNKIEPWVFDSLRDIVERYDNAVDQVASHALVDDFNYLLKKCNEGYDSDFPIAPFKEEDKIGSKIGKWDIVFRAKQTLRFFNESIAEKKDDTRMPLEENKENVERFDIFFSYSTQDSNIAKELTQKLTDSGLTCFLAEKDIQASEIWESRIRDALSKSKLVLVLITPRSIGSSWVLVESGAAWGLNKKVLPLLMFVKPEDLVDPIRKHQARLVETPTQVQTLINELSPREPITSTNITGQWLDPRDNDTVYFKQMGNKVVGFYNFDGRNSIVGIYLGTIKGRNFEYSWKWLDGSLEGKGRMSLSEDNSQMSGDWWYNDNRDEIEHVGYRKVSRNLPSWLSEQNFDKYKSFFKK